MYIFQHWKSTTSVDIKKCAIKKASHKSISEGSESARERRIALYKSNHHHHVEGLKTEKAQEPTVESLAQGIWKLRISEVECRV